MYAVIIQLSDSLHPPTVLLPIPLFLGQMKEYRDEAEDLLQRLSLVRNRVHTVQSTLVALKEEESALIDTLTQCKRARPPIRMVSDDILREIFIRCLPAKVTFDCREAPWLLCHVCSSWRNLAHNFAALWSNARMQVPLLQDQTQLDAQNVLYSAWLDRCKLADVKLEVVFLRPWDTKFSLPGEPPVHFGFLFTAVRNPSHCSISNLTLRDLPFAVLQKLPPGGFPNLQSLVIGLGDNGRARDTDWSRLVHPLKAFKDCPSLRRIALGRGSGLLNHPLENIFTFPWSQITHFICKEGILDQSIWYILATATNLQYAHLQITSSYLNDIEASTIRPMMILPNISALSISFWRYEDGHLLLPSFFRTFDFPNLHTLRLVGSHLNFAQTLPHERNLFLGKIQTLKNLKTLSLAVNDVSTEFCESVLERLPSVVSLDLEMLEGYETILDYLQLVNGIGCLPKLKDINLEVGGSRSYYAPRFAGRARDEIVSAESLQSMVESRRIGCAPDKRIHQVTFYGEREWQLNEEKRPYIKCLEDLKEEGLIVVLNQLDPENRTSADSSTANLFLDRDPAVVDWPGISELCKLYNI